MFTFAWTERATSDFAGIQAAAQQAQASRATAKRSKSSKQEGLFKQVVKCLDLLHNDPRHPGLQTHEYHSIDNPVSPGSKVFEAYAQNRTPGAYRIFWCYGPEKGQITLIAITPHP